jgi:hypothetical protein
MTGYVMTDDPRDPCSYDVQWMTADGMDWPENYEEAVPFIGPGRKATRIFKRVHDSCERAAMLYDAEAAR